jgi:hypothetical protein
LSRGDGGVIGLVCHRGHWKLGENAYIMPPGNHRVCRTCIRLRTEMRAS